MNKLPMPFILLANVQLLENKIDDLLLRLSYQQDIKNSNILCFTEMWLNEETEKIELAGSRRIEMLPLVRRGLGVCVFLSITVGAQCRILKKS